MIRAKMLDFGTSWTVLLVAHRAKRRKDSCARGRIQGTGFFTKDSQQNGTLQHSTGTGGSL